MTKILHVIDHMGVGGAQRIMAGLAESGLGKVVFALRRKSANEISMPADVQFYVGGSSLFSILFSVFKLDRIIKNQAFEIVHCHLTASFLIGSILSLKHRDVKFVFHEHGEILSDRFLYKLFLRLLPKEVVIFASSDLLRKRILQTGYRSKVIVLPNFIDLEKYYQDQVKRKKIRERWGFKNKDILIGFAGRLIEQKGWWELLNAFSLLESEEKLFLLFMGSGPDKARIEKMVGELGLRSSVKLFGFQSEMSSFYNGIDIFINPTKLEAFGLVQLEAQACGVPVIVSDIDGVRETLNSESGVLVPPGDPTTLAYEIRRLIDHPKLREEFSRKGLVNVQRFSKDQYVVKLKQVYQEL
jgi:glycosyltransferase involved in cell wall biosynthesis